METCICKPRWQYRTDVVRDANGDLRLVDVPIPDVKILNATSSPEIDDPFLIDAVCRLTGKGCEKLLRVVKNIRSERVVLLKKYYRLIRRNHRMRETIRRERLKGASMDRLWDIELRRRSLAGELTKIYRRFGTWE